MRKTGKKLLFAFTLMTMLLTGFAGAHTTAQAAARKGLVKSGGKYYFYKNGRKVTKAWKTIKQKKVKYKFYFNKKGVACQAKLPPDKTYVVKLFKIGKKKYGFDTKAHRVKKGVYLDNKYRLTVFGNKGVYDAAATNALRAKFPKSRFGEPKSRQLYNDLVSTFGKPLKEQHWAADCGGWNDKDTFLEYALTFSYFEVSLFYNVNTEEFAINEFYSIKVK